VYVHTINDIVIFINPKMKVPRNYHRFVGLMEQLFDIGKVPPDAKEPLMYIKNMTLKRLIKNVLKKNWIILLTESGELVSPDLIAKVSINEDLPVVIGGFPHGDFGPEIYALAKYKYSIYPSPLDSWVVADRIVEAWERQVGIYAKSNHR
jgi:rRNA small subunit pseudouridine methyltransferase Nep1